LSAAHVEPHIGWGLHKTAQNVVASRAAHHDARGTVIDVTLSESPDATTSGAGQHRGGDIEPQHFCESACCGVTVDVYRFCHLSFFLD
jgi:hypothetical protein